MRPKRLTDYLDENAWSQADLAREAGISVGSVSRAIAGDNVTRRTANAIIAALDHAHQEKRLTVRAEHITIKAVRGLHISNLRRKKPKKEPVLEGAGAPG